MEIVTLNEHDNLFDRFPYIGGLIHAHFINVHDVHFFVEPDANGEINFKMITTCKAIINDGEWITETVDAFHGETVSVYHDENDPTNERIIRTRMQSSVML